MSDEKTYETTTVLPCQGAKTENWYAWLDTMPPPPDALHVIGEVQVPNPGVQPVLTKRVPQGINPDILLLNLHLIQRPGIWPQVVVVVPVRYDERPAQNKYTNVNIFCDNDVIADIKVEVIS